jgi:hypothetical protein
LEKLWAQLKNNNWYIPVGIQKPLLTNFEKALLTNFEKSNKKLYGNNWKNIENYVN